MRIIVSDSSCLIDLRKVNLLAAFLQLSYEILIPNTLFEDELLKFSALEKQMLCDVMEIIDLPGTSVIRAQEVIRELPQLSVHNGFAFALAETNPGCILLARDGALRALARKSGMEVHGVLWVIDQLHSNDVCAVGTLVAALHAFANDSTIRLPRKTLAAYLKRYEEHR